MCLGTEIFGDRKEKIITKYTHKEYIKVYKYSLSEKCYISQWTRGRYYGLSTAKKYQDKLSNNWGFHGYLIDPEPDYFYKTVFVCLIKPSWIRQIGSFYGNYALTSNHMCFPEPGKHVTTVNFFRTECKRRGL